MMRVFSDPSTGIKEISAPYRNAEKITVVIKNYGTDSLLQYPCHLCHKPGYGNGNLPFIKPKDSLLYTFTKTANMSAYQIIYT